MTDVIDKPCSAHVHDLHPSENFGERAFGAAPRLVILHYTGMANCEKAVHWLSHPDSKVSAHYVIDCDGRITQLVSEDKRAWHAGVSYWAGITDVNSASIGLEIHNPGHDMGYPDFPPEQMRAVRDLLADIRRRWRIPASGVLAHSDIAPARKIDPGEKFDWRWLAEEGVGLWIAPEPVSPLIGAVSEAMGPDQIARGQRLLHDIGYGLTATGRNDAQSRTVVSAFQRRWRPARIDGLMDPSTLITAERVLAAMGGQPPPLPLR